MIDFQPYCRFGLERGFKSREIHTLQSYGSALQYDAFCDNFDEVFIDVSIWPLHISPFAEEALLVI